MKRSLECRLTIPLDHPWTPRCHTPPASRHTRDRDLEKRERTPENETLIVKSESDA